MAELLLGPLLRYAGDTVATIWVETDAPCEVEVLGRRARTFHVEGHHYALVVVDGLEPGSTRPYEVHLDGRRVWPQADSPFPPSVIRTGGRGRPVEIAFGSCRVTLPHEPPYTLSPDDDERGKEHDALYALAHRMAGEPVERWPHKLLMLGDQVYVDEGSPRVRERIRARRDVTQPPGEEVADFEEYTWLYHESWSEPALRWLLSTVATAMVWDDHDMHDDWNISEQWVRDIRAHSWWQQRVEGGIVSYWIYQHLGNLAPSDLAELELFERVKAAGDGGPLLREFARAADRQADGTRWSYCRDFDGTRLVAIDSRAGRLLGEERHSQRHEHHRAMVDDHEWEWIAAHATGDVDHLIVATSLPWLMLHGLHFIEAWNEAVCDGAWGALAARAGEKLRRAADLEHWAAFDDSFRRLARLLGEVAAGKHGRPPATIAVLAGDVHHAFVADVAFPRALGARSHVVQIVCSPFRNDLARGERRLMRFGGSPVGRALGRALARSAGVADPPVRWRIADGPWFDNQVATLRLHGRAASLALDKTVPGEQHPVFERVLERRLA